MRKVQRVSTLSLCAPLTGGLTEFRDSRLKKAAIHGVSLPSTLPVGARSATPFAPFRPLCATPARRNRRLTLRQAGDAAFRLGGRPSACHLAAQRPFPESLP